MMAVLSQDGGNMPATTKKKLIISALAVLAVAVAALWALTFIDFP
jgi:hypothetical protein